MKTNLPANIVFFGEKKLGTITSMEWISPVTLNDKCFSCGKLLEFGEFHKCHLKKDSSLAISIQKELNE